MPSLKVLQQKKMMIEGILSVVDVPLEGFVRLPWYGEYWHLVGRHLDLPEMAGWQDRFKKNILAWMEEKSPLNRQFGALALLLCAPLAEVRPHIQLELWPERLKSDFRVLEAWDALQSGVAADQGGGTRG